MKKLLFILLLVWSGFTSAVNMVGTIGPYEITLSDQPCKESSILEAIKPEFHHIFQAGTVKEGREVTKMCWVVNVIDPTKIFMVDEYEFTGNVPMAVFVPKPVI